MAEVVRPVDDKDFATRLLRIYDSWQRDNTDEGLWKGADAIAIVVGKDTDNVYQRSVVLQNWLFNQEVLLETIVLLSENKHVQIVTSEKKGRLFTSLPTASAVTEAGIAVTVLQRAKGSDNAEVLNQLLEQFKSSKKGKKLGLPDLKEQLEGDFATGWMERVKSAGAEIVDLNGAFGDLMAVKDMSELNNVKKSAALTSAVLKNSLLPRIEKVIDEEKETKHTALADDTEAVFAKPADVSSKLESEFCECAIDPLIQSGGEYDWKPSAQSTEKNLHFGTIIVTLGARYRYFCSALTRTFLIDPTKEQEENYKILLEVHRMVLKSLVPGVKLASLVEKAREVVKRSKNPRLVDSLIASCGFGMGIEFRESSLSLNPRNTRTAKPGMVFNVFCGFEKLKNTSAKDKNSETYALFIADTVIVGANAEAEPEVVTHAVKNLSDVSYFLGGSDDEDKEILAEAQNLHDDDMAVLPDRLRNRDKDGAAVAGKAKQKAAAADHSAHQAELARQLQEEAEKRFADQDTSEVVVKRGLRKINAYATPSHFPDKVKPGQIFVDTANDAVLFPIYGVHVPFHVVTIKSVTKTDENDYVSLRLNFITPGGTAFGSKDQPAFEDPNAVFIREITYRSTNQAAMNNTHRLIKELRKRVVARETERREKEDIVEQESLVLTKAGNVPRLMDVQIRPNLSAGRKTVGMLECHSNGFRFTSRKGEKLDITFKNVKQAFFQPAEKEVIVLVHLHLKNPIMIGRKKSQDVQFFTEVTEVSSALDGKLRPFEREEIEDEQREREHRAKLNNEFQKFVQKVDAVTAGRMPEIDIPYRELGFFGVVKTTVFLLPTVNCLVHLVEPPFLVIMLDEVEIVHFERVQFQLKAFDCVFVFKDYTKPVQHIGQIQTHYLDTIKEWLDSSNIKFYEGPANLNWPRIMKHIQSDPKAFFEEGGWSFLADEDEQNPEGGGGGAADDGEDASSEFEQYSESEDDESSEMSDDDEGTESSEIASGAGDEGESEEGKTFEELEEEARQDDLKREGKIAAKQQNVQVKRKGEPMSGPPAKKVKR